MQSLFLMTKRIYHFGNGTWPEARAWTALHRRANLDTLSGKIRHKMAFDRNPMLPIFADKLAVRNYVSLKVGEEYLSDIVQVFDNPQDLLNFDFPQEFALKSNHGSGGMLIVSNTAPRENLFPTFISEEEWAHYFVHPENFDPKKALILANKWISQNYYYRLGHYPEWAYKSIPPQIYVEELMKDPHGNLPWDYKFAMINGKCRFIHVRVAEGTRDLFTPQWERVEGINLYPASGLRIPKPEQLSEMIGLAEKLSEGIDFIRVDLYQTNNGVKFGELTNYPDGGFGSFHPDALDVALGADWEPSY